MKPTRTFSELDWNRTPGPVRNYIMALERTLYDMNRRVEAHEKRIEKLENQNNKNSHNSSKPPSSDPPFKRKKRTQKKATVQKAVKKAINRTNSKCWTQPKVTD